MSERKYIGKPDLERGGLAIAKALHYANACAAQLRTAIIELQAIQGEKQFYERLAKLADKVSQDIKLEIPDPNVRRAMSQDMDDKYKVDAVVELFMQLNPERWEMAEDYLNQLIKQQNAQNKEINQEA